MSPCECGIINKPGATQCLCGKQLSISVKQKATETRKSRISSIKKVSDKQALMNELYGMTRQVYLSLFPVCEVTGCRNPSTTIHHRAGRIGYLGKMPLLLDWDNFLGCCMTCHTKIEQNSIWAIDNGYSALRTGL